MMDRNLHRSERSQSVAADPEKAADREAKIGAVTTKQRLAAALRENLHRRKAQERGRRAAEDQRELPD
jgi:hypothetical protein